MTVISTAEARNRFSNLLDRVAVDKERVVLTRRNRELAAVVPLEDLELLEQLVTRYENDEDLQDARSALDEAARNGTVSLRELKDELGL